MPHDNVNRALAVLTSYLEKSGHQIATASNADDVLNAFDAMRQNLREEAYRTLLENKQKLFNDLRSVTTSFGLTIQSMAALGQDTKLMQKLQGTITKITADLSFTGEDDVNQDGIRDNADIETNPDAALTDLSVDPAVKQSDELFQSLTPNSQAPAVPAEEAAEDALQQNQGGFADDVDTDDMETSTPGSGGLADDLDDTKSLDQAVEDATKGKDEAPAEQSEDQSTEGDEGGDPFASIPEGGNEGGSPFDGTSNNDTGDVGSGGTPVADEGGSPSDDQLNDLFNQEFPPAKKAAPQAQQAQSSVELSSFDGLSSIKKVPLLVATAADGTTAFYRAVSSYMDGDTETVASMLAQIKEQRGAASAVKSLARLVKESNLVEAYRI